MRKFISMYLKKMALLFRICSTACSRFSKVIYRSQREKLMDKWRESDGDNTLMCEYDLNEDSIVFDLGGYIGDFTSCISSMYNSHIYVFEPVEKYYNIIKNKFKNNKKIKCFNFGFLDKEKEDKINILNDGSSIFKKSNKGNFEKIQLKNLRVFMNDNSIESIDLLKINVEGSEYDILEDLLRFPSVVSKILNIQVQFHNISADSRDRMLSIKKQLIKTHRLTYEFEFIWENWQLRDEYKMNNKFNDKVTH